MEVTAISTSAIARMVTKRETDPRNSDHRTPWEVAVVYKSGDKANSTCKLFRTKVQAVTWVRQQLAAGATVKSTTSFCLIYGEDRTRTAIIITN